MQSPISLVSGSRMEMEIVMEILKKSIVNRWIINGVIEEEDRELYEYGIEITVEHLLNIVTCTFIAIVIGELLAYIVLLIVFMQLRNYAGGIHASSFFKCYVCSALVIIISLICIKYSLVHIWIYRVVALISAIYLFAFEHGETKNREVSQREKEMYAVKKKIILICLIMLVVIMAIFNITRIEQSMESAIVISGISVGMNYLDTFIIKSAEYAEKSTEYADLIEDYSEI